MPSNSSASFAEGPDGAFAIDDMASLAESLAGCIGAACVSRDLAERLACGHVLSQLR